jgi:hypothetical protein
VRDGALIRFGPYELAARLSYFLWSTMPDATLLAAAATGQLATPDQTEAQARRLLADPRARATVTEFHLWWLDVVDLPQVLKDPPPLAPAALWRSMLAETSAFASDVVLGSGRLTTLLTASTSFVDATLAPTYGVTVGGPGLQPVSLDPTQRAGVFTQGAFLAMHADPGGSNPARRGYTLLRALTCSDITIPDNAEVPSPPELKPPFTTRKLFESVVDNACTGSCHVIYDAGFAFENYDAVGAYRRTDAGLPVDASGVLHFASGDLRFANAVELLHGLADRPEVASCLPREWLRFLTRRPDGAEDTPSLKVAEDALRRSSDLREMLVALTRSRAFTHRAPAAGEVMP